MDQRHETFLYEKTWKKQLFVQFIFDSVQCTLGTGEWAGVVGCCRHAAVSAVLVVSTKMGPAVVKWHTTVAWATSTGVTWSWAKKVETRFPL